MEAVRNWVVYHFHDTSDTSPPKSTQDVDDNRTLRPDAANLAAFLYRLQQQHHEAFRRIAEHVQRIAPFFAEFRLAPLAARPDKIKFEWRQRDSDAYFDAASLSDGTLRFICLATLLLQPRHLMPSVIYRRAGTRATPGGIDSLGRNAAGSLGLVADFSRDSVRHLA
jgi:predicted ATPase